MICWSMPMTPPDGLGLHGLRVVDDLLEHAHDAARCLVLRVGLEARGRRWPRGLLLLPDGEKGRLLVEAPQNGQGLRQQLLRRPLVRDGHLELLVLLLTVLAGALELELHLSDLRLERLDLLRERLDGEREVLDLRLQVGLLALLLLSLELVRVELVHAEVLVLDLVPLLLL